MLDGSITVDRVENLTAGDRFELRDALFAVRAGVKMPIPLAPCRAALFPAITPAREPTA